MSSFIVIQTSYIKSNRHFQFSSASDSLKQFVENFSAELNNLFLLSFLSLNVKRIALEKWLQ